MSFNFNSLERLRKLRRELPESLHYSDPPSKLNPKSNSALHPIETEENPEKLFKELINASSDGEIPPHLIARLKEVELHNFKEEDDNNEERSLNASSNKAYNQCKTSYNKSSKQINDLYISFKRLLLEEEEE